jgi:hypothetical protein
MKNKGILIFNIIMIFLLFLSSQLVLFLLNEKIVQGFGLFIDSRFPYNQIQEAPPTITAPLPNYPLLLFLFTVIVDILYVIITKFKGKSSPKF